MEHINWLFSQQGFWAVLGALTGASITAATNFWINWRQSRTQRKIERMRMASGLRSWISRTTDHYFETYNWVSSHGNGGRVHLKIPEFELEENLESISHLDSKTAARVFNLLHEKNDANGEIQDTLEYQDEDDAAEIFLRRSLEIIIEGLQIYAGIAKILGWAHKIVDDDIESSLRGELERRREKVREQMNTALARILDDESNSLNAKL